MGRTFNFTNAEINKRNKSVFEKLHFEYSEGLVRFAEGFLFDRESAEDVVQNLFIYIWDNAENVRFNTSAKSYLYQATRNRCLNIIRDLQIRDKKELLFIEATINSQNENEFFSEELFNKLDRAIEELPDKMLEVVKLKYLESRKIKEIAKSLNVAESTIKTQLSRAKEKIANSLLIILYLFC